MNKMPEKKEIKKLLAIYKRRIRKDFMSEIDKGLVKTYLEEFVKDLLGES